MMTVYLPGSSARGFFPATAFFAARSASAVGFEIVEAPGKAFCVAARV